MLAAGMVQSGCKLLCVRSSEPGGPGAPSREHGRTPHTSLIQMRELNSSAEDFLSPDTSPPPSSNPWVSERVEPSTSLLRARSAARRRWLLGPSPRLDLIVSPERRTENARLPETRDQRKCGSDLFMEGILKYSSHVLDGVAEAIDAVPEGLSKPLFSAMIFFLKC